MADSPYPNRIRELRQARGLTLQELAALTPHPTKEGGVDLAGLQKIEVGKRQLTKGWMDRIAQALGVAPTELIASGVQEVRRVPLLGSIPAGNWRQAIEEPIDLIPSTLGGPNTFALSPQGDSMDKIVSEGGVIFIDPDDRELRDGKLYAIMNPDGETTFKQFRSKPMRLEPCSSNPAHRTIAIGEEGFVTVGRVIGQQSEL